MDLGAISIMGYSAFPIAPALLKSHHPIILCHIQDTLQQMNQRTRKSMTMHKALHQSGDIDELYV